MNPVPKPRPFITRQCSWKVLVSGTDPEVPTYEFKVSLIELRTKMQLDIEYLGVG